MRVYLPLKSSSSASNSSVLSVVMLASTAAKVCSWMHRNASLMEGPSTFSGFTGASIESQRDKQTRERNNPQIGVGQCQEVIQMV